MELEHCSQELTGQVVATMGEEAAGVSGGDRLEGGAGHGDQAREGTLRRRGRWVFFSLVFPVLSNSSVIVRSGRDLADVVEACAGILPLLGDDVGVSRVGLFQIVRNTKFRARLGERPDSLGDEVDRVVAPLQDTLDDDEWFTSDDVTALAVEVRKHNDIE